MGTRGQLIRDGARYIKIHGEDVPARARICSLDAFSAHADCGEILRRLKKFRDKPKKTLVVHGEEESSRAPAAEIEQKPGWKTYLPNHTETHKLERP
jgi:metallo-beta-lactamase family protein